MNWTFCDWISVLGAISLVVFLLAPMVLAIIGFITKSKLVERMFKQLNQASKIYGYALATSTALWFVSMVVGYWIDAPRC